jgi:hypothetical protein
VVVVGMKVRTKKGRGSKYTNDADTDNENSSDEDTNPTVLIKLIKPISARVRNARCLCNRCNDYHQRHQLEISLPFSSYENIDPTKTSTLTEDQFLLCNSHIRSFILKDRIYGMSLLILEVIVTYYVIKRSSRCRRACRTQVPFACY